MNKLLIGLVLLSVLSVAQATDIHLDGKKNKGNKDISIPNDCTVKKLKALATGLGCTIESGGKHWRVLNSSGVFVTSIPYSEVDIGVCRGIVKAVVEGCSN